jgi:hypothetical protein
MRIIKIVAITLMFVLTVPTIISAISSFYDVNCELISCEKATEEEKEESKSEKDFDDLEEYLLSQTEYLSEYHKDICLYSFRGKHFIDIVSDIVTPPPEEA